MRLTTRGLIVLATLGIMVAISCVLVGVVSTGDAVWVDRETITVEVTP